jgi:hypothetical protein
MGVGRPDIEPESFILSSSVLLSSVLFWAFTTCSLLLPIIKLAIAKAITTKVLRFAILTTVSNYLVRKRFALMSYEELELGHTA